MTSDLLLMPSPRRLERVSGPGALHEAPVVEQPDPRLPAEGFTVVVAADRVTVGYADEQGLRYARRTLAQLRGQDPARYPPVAIEDWPDYPVRGFMLDISRNRVPTRETLSRLVELMALSRLNQLQLYTEHTFAYAAHEKVWRHASPVTAADLRWLDGICRDEGIELVANQNTFGHMAPWLRQPEYRWRAECPDGYELGGVRFDAATLQPTEENAEFVLGLLEELLDNLTSRSVNVGCDETFELGQGRSAAAVLAHGPERVYFDHLLRITRPLAEKGRTVEFWYDIPPENAGLLSELPHGVIPIAWGYEALPDPDSGAPRIDGRWSPHRGLTRNIPELAKWGRPFWVAPGTSSWNSFVGRLDNAFANLRQYARTGREFGAAGYLVTDWGDNGHLQPPSVSFPAMLYGGAVSWCEASNADLDIAGVLGRYVYGDRQLAAAQLRLADTWAMTGQGALNTSPMFAALLPGPFVPVYGTPDVSCLDATLGVVEDACAAIEASSPECPDAGWVQRELQMAARLVRHGTWRMVAALGGSTPPVSALAADLADTVEEVRACWLGRSRPGGLTASLAPLQQARSRFYG